MDQINIYLSASWDINDNSITEFVAKILARENFLIVGDDPIFKSVSHPRGLNYVERIDDIMKDCSGVVVILPKRDTSQTTSPYMLLEILMAEKHRLPILFLNEEGVVVTYENKVSGIVVNFGKQLSRNQAGSLEKYYDSENRDEYLKSISSIELRGTCYVAPHIELPSSSERIKEYASKLVESVESFSKLLNLSRPKSYVFNIIPFSMEKEYREIRNVVLRETGLSCFLATDFTDGKKNIRSVWEESIANAKFIIADITGIRPNCIYEVGYAHGKGIEMFGIGKKIKRSSIPFGLDKMEIKVYRNKKQLLESVRKICLAYKRKVYNFDLRETQGQTESFGIPSWYYEEATSPVKQLRLLAIFLFIDTGMFGYILFSTIFTNEVAGALSLALTCLGIFLTITGKLQKSIEEKMIFHSKWALRLLIGSIPMLVMLYFLLKS